MLSLQIPKRAPQLAIADLTAPGEQCRKREFWNDSPTTFGILHFSLTETACISRRC